MREPLIVKVPTLLSRVHHQLEHDWKPEDTDLEATIQEVLADPIARAAYDRARAERLRRPAIKTFCRAMRRYEAQARKLKLNPDDVAYIRLLRLAKATALPLDNDRGLRPTIELREESLRRYAAAVRRFAAESCPRFLTAQEWPHERRRARREAFLYERAADAVAKLRAAFAALEQP